MSDVLLEQLTAEIKGREAAFERLKNGKKLYCFFSTNVEFPGFKIDWWRPTPLPQIAKFPYLGLYCTVTVLECGNSQVYFSKLTDPFHMISVGQISLQSKWFLVYKINSLVSGAEYLNRAYAGMKEAKDTDFEDSSCVWVTKPKS